MAHSMRMLETNGTSGRQAQSEYGVVAVIPSCRTVEVLAESDMGKRAALLVPGRRRSQFPSGIILSCSYIRRIYALLAGAMSRNRLLEKYYRMQNEWMEPLEQ
ncbi:hypothetical protein VC83_03886 [Pseudogymnoascus destructans]|uniref:Uncharacterized protein n=1 Tax=Pseudogymnoascus destructans TaxID=655981 RepID=A0A177ABN7_9PEZI|nr:uncharacterized protein VC83_03886 [Pseudogymnoascus destructans]OAF59518.1 hypothetical protein VC83_03886 [Pseudogymnoascus destructans]